MNPQLRIFKRQVGLFYTKNGSPQKIGNVGQSDLYGLLKTKYGLLHIEIEVKSGAAVQTKEQRHWQEFIESMNGLYILARDPIQVELEIKKAIEHII